MHFFFQIENEKTKLMLVQRLMRSHCIFSEYDSHMNAYAFVYAHTDARFHRMKRAKNGFDLIAQLIHFTLDFSCMFKHVFNGDSKQ